MPPLRMTSPSATASIIHDRIAGSIDRKIVSSSTSSAAGARTGTLSAMKLPGAEIPVGLARNRMRWLIVVIAGAPSRRSARRS
jgi:hypothetical protein